MTFKELSEIRRDVAKQNNIDLDAGETLEENDWVFSDLRDAVRDAVRKNIIEMLFRYDVRYIDALDWLGSVQNDLRQAMQNKTVQPCDVKSVE